MQLPIDGIIGMWLSGGSPTFREEDFSGPIRLATWQSAPRIAFEWLTSRDLVTRLSVYACFYEKALRASLMRTS
jgi:hypothetical protein